MTGWNGVRTYWSFEDETILAHWRDGLNTLDIARALPLPESEVWNRLPRILQRARQDAEWSAA